MAYSITISLSARQLRLYQDRALIRSYPIGVGKSTTPTPIGTFAIASKNPNPGGPFGAMWLGLSVPHYGIHGTNNPASIGGFVSHGCIRMHNRDVLAVARLVPLGTQVTIGR
ncbi:MAG: ErfK/YbiS/YcfS/YnhG family protein [Anaerosporomusa subterranea]|jgi:lipoprotein-anchoring transpeptidase ErfK/SrfK|nr:ErfK/YbiS/YcfS/YnhG family protein [Anaerosporomusa subterranea]